MPTTFNRIVRADRPLATALALIGIGFVVSLLAGLVLGLLADDFRSAFGLTVTVGMIVTGVGIVFLLGGGALRR